MESITFKRFTTALEDLFDFDDECDVPDIQDTGRTDSILLLAITIYCWPLLLKRLTFMLVTFQVKVTL